MTAYSDEELKGMLLDLESEVVERKRSISDRSAIRRTICAFANDLAGQGKTGVIFIGAEDDGSCSGISITDELLKNLAQMRSDGNIMPLPVISVQKRVIDSCELVTLFVEPSSEPPVRYQGRVFVKIGPTVQLASPADEKLLAERRRAADLTFDLRPATSATFDDMDIDYFRSQYLIRAVAPEVLEQNRRPSDHQLESLRFSLGGVPTFGGLLALGRDPQRWLPGAYIQFLRLNGPSLSDPIRDQKMITGRLEDVLRRIDELLEINISVSTDITSAPREIREPDYPVVALQQFVRNAVMHRSYEGTNAPVRVYWYSDRIEIQNPGGLYGHVNAQNFGTGVTDYRNPLIAEIMYNLGFAQRFGIGLPLAKEALSKNGNPEPEFSIQPAYVGVIVRAVQ